MGTHEVLWIGLDKILSLLVLPSYDSVTSSWNECMQVIG